MGLRRAFLALISPAEVVQIGPAGPAGQKGERVCRPVPAPIRLVGESCTPFSEVSRAQEDAPRACMPTTTGPTPTARTPPHSPPRPARHLTIVPFLSPGRPPQARHCSPKKVTFNVHAVGLKEISGLVKFPAASRVDRLGCSDSTRWAAQPWWLVHYRGFIFRSPDRRCCFPVTAAASLETFAHRCSWSLFGLGRDDGRASRLHSQRGSLAPRPAPSHARGSSDPSPPRAG